MEDENDASVTDRKRKERERYVDARGLLISDEQFEAFCDRHRGVESFVPEPNDLMVSSYLILDEYLCFLDKGDGRGKQSEPILMVGVQKALEQVRFDQDAFVKRGGMYEWSNDAGSGGGAIGTARLEDLEF